MPTGVYTRTTEHRAAVSAALLRPEVRAKLRAAKLAMWADGQRRAHLITVRQGRCTDTWAASEARMRTAAAQRRTLAPIVAAAHEAGTSARALAEELGLSRRLLKRIADEIGIRFRRTAAKPKTRRAFRPPAEHRADYLLIRRKVGAAEARRIMGFAGA